MKIGLIIADIDEYKPLESAIVKYGAKEDSVAGRTAHTFKVGQNDVISVHCGIGKVNAAVAATALAEMGTDVILNFGLSGGISGIALGEVCIPDRFLEHDFDLTCLGCKPCEKPQQNCYIYESNADLRKKLAAVFEGAKIGAAVTGDCFVQNNILREKLKTEFSAMTCDMETAAIAYVCHTYNIPFAAVRKVSDDAGNDAKDTYRALNVQREVVLSHGVLAAISEL